MRDLVSRAKQGIHEDCFAKSCKEQGCTVSLQGMGKARAIVDMNCKLLGLKQKQPRCDYVYVGQHAGANWVVPLELKGRNFNANEVSKQIQTGAKIVERKIPIEDLHVYFRPFVVHKGKVHKIQRANLKKKQYKIRFRGGEYEISLMSSGSALANALRKP